MRLPNSLFFRGEVLAFSIAASFAVLSASAALAQTVSPPQPQPQPRYEFREFHAADGIGKFYCGREIARVMGHEAADWLERPERDQEEHTSQLVEALSLKPGQVVADIGAGTGYFTRRMAVKVRPRGKVFAVDIQPEMLQILTNTLTRAGITNVVPILGTDQDARLPAGSVDLVLMVDVYHEFDHPYEMMTTLCHALKPGGRVAFVEYRAEDPAVPIKPLHKLSEAQVRKEMAAQPLDWIWTSRVLPRQHIIVFRKKADVVPAKPAAP
jgi:SAM-dependent methyltransferase